MSHVQRDLRYAWRSVIQTPGLSLVIVLSIALGIAANTTVFSVANGLLWGLLPVKDPGRVVMFSEGESFTYPDYLDYREQTADIFENEVAGHFPIIPASVGGTGAPERVWGQAVSGNFFAMLGMNMEVGRAILPQEDAVIGRDAVVVLSHGLWVRRFGGDRQIVNRPVVLNGKPYTVVGVAPAGFEGMDRGIVSEFWVPLAMVETIMPYLGSDIGARSNRDNHWVMLDGRLKARPRPGSVRRAMVAINVVAIPVGLFDYVYKTDYMFLRAKPPTVSLLDVFGPWPWYILACEAAGAVLFTLLYLPFRRKPLRHGKPDEERAELRDAL